MNILVMCSSQSYSFIIFFFVRPTIQTSTLLKVEAAYLHFRIFYMKNDSNDFQISCHLIFSFQLYFYEQLLLVDHHFIHQLLIFFVCKRRSSSRVAWKEKTEVPHICTKVWYQHLEPESFCSVWVLCCWHLLDKTHTQSPVTNQTLLSALFHN